MAAWIIKFLEIADKLIYCFSALTVCYLTFFALVAHIKKKDRYPKAGRFNRFIIFIPAYKEDNIIFDTVNSIIKQDYPSDKYEIVVISDKMEEGTNKQLSLLPINLLIFNLSSASSKANALIFAVNNIPDGQYDIAAILDADNIVPENFLADLNDAFCSGAAAVQTHRTAKNLNTDIAILDAISEEINNSIFRKGHVNVGLSSALIGSGMAFDFKWFVSHAIKLKTSGEDKELEMMLFKDRVFIDYLDYTFVYDEKTSKKKVFYNQRRRWIAAQFESLKSEIQNLPSAIVSVNLDYLNKIIHLMILPKIILLGIIGIMSLTMSFIMFSFSVKWWILLFVIIFALIISIPSVLWSKKSIIAVRRLPLVFFLMFINLFRTKGANKKYIHTEKTI